ncbi:MAG: DUF190 domain-containing protein [Salinarimonas sp.]
MSEPDPVDLERIKVEILLDSPLVRRVEEAAERHGLTGWTVLPTLSGSGRSGRWRDDQVTGAASKVLFITVCNREKAEAFTRELSPVLEAYGSVLLKSKVEVVRPGKF